MKTVKWHCLKSKRKHKQVATKAAALKIEMRNVEDLIPYELNAKKHEKDQVAKIALEISRHGWDVPIVLDRHGVIIKGHGRRLAAIELGMTKVPVVVRTDLNPEQVRAARLSDNRVAISDLDPEVLRAELATLEADMKGIFDDKELDFGTADLGMMNDDVFDTDMDAVLESQKKEVGEKSAAAMDPETRIPLSRAFGFKDVSAAGQFAINKLMARAEAATGRSGDAALTEYLVAMEAVSAD